MDKRIRKSATRHLRNLNLNRLLVWIAVLLLAVSLCGCGAEEKQTRSLSDLGGGRVAVEIGTLHAELVQNHPSLSDCEVSFAPSLSSALGMLLSGNADAVVTDYVMAREIIGEFDGLVILDEPVDSAGYGFGLRPDDVRLSDINRVIGRLRTDGSIDRIMRKWVSNGEKTLPNAASEGKNGKFLIGVDPDAEPLCYKDENGNIVGLDIEILLAVAEELDLEPAYVEASLDELPAMLLSGQVDLIASGLTITAERQKLFAFTDEYLEAGSVAVVRETETGAEGTGGFDAIRRSFERTVLENDRWKDLLNGFGVTVFLSLVTILLGTILGVLFFLWEYSGEKVGRAFLPRLCSLFDLLPMTTWLIIVYYLIFPGHLTGNFASAVFAFTFTFGISVYATLSGVCRALPRGQWDAVFTLGYGRFGALVKIFLSEMLPDIVSDLESTVILHIRDTSVVGFIALADIQAVADTISADTAEPFFPVVLSALAYILLAGTVKRLFHLWNKHLARNEKEKEVKARVEKRCFK